MIAMSRSLVVRTVPRSSQIRISGKGH